MRRPPGPPPAGLPHVPPPGLAGQAHPAHPDQSPKPDLVLRRAGDAATPRLHPPGMRGCDRRGHADGGAGAQTRVVLVDLEPGSDPGSGPGSCPGSFAALPESRDPPLGGGGRAGGAGGCEWPRAAAAFALRRQRDLAGRARRAGPWPPDPSRPAGTGRPGPGGGDDEAARSGAGDGRCGVAAPAWLAGCRRNSGPTGLPMHGSESDSCCRPTAGKQASTAFPADGA